MKKSNPICSCHHIKWGRLCSNGRFNKNEHTLSVFSYFDLEIVKGYRRWLTFKLLPSSYFYDEHSKSYCQTSLTWTKILRMDIQTQLNTLRYIHGRLLAN